MQHQQRRDSPSLAGGWPGYALAAHRARPLHTTQPSFFSSSSPPPLASPTPHLTSLSLPDRIAGWPGRKGGVASPHQGSVSPGLPSRWGGRKVLQCTFGVWANGWRLDLALIPAWTHSSLQDLSYATSNVSNGHRMAILASFEVEGVFSSPTPPPLLLLSLLPSLPFSLLSSFSPLPPLLLPLPHSAAPSK